MPAAVPHASAREPLCDDTPQTVAAVLRDAISFLFSFGYRLSFFAETPTNRLRLSPNLLPQSRGLKSLKYTKYSCASQVLSCAKISRRTLLPIDSEFPNISSKPFGIWAKNSGNTLRRSFFCVAAIPAICGRCAPKKKSGRNLSCGHGNSTGNRKSLTMRVQVGILRTLRLSCHKRHAQISITSQLYHKILWLSRKQRLTATRKSVLPGDIHTPEAAQNTAANGARSQRAPTGLPFLWNVRFLSAGAHPAQHPPA